METLKKHNFKNKTYLATNNIVAAQIHYKHQVEQIYKETLKPIKIFGIQFVKARTKYSFHPISEGYPTFNSIAETLLSYGIWLEDGTRLYYRSSKNNFELINDVLYLKTYITISTADGTMFTTFFDNDVDAEEYLDSLEIKKNLFEINYDKRIKP